MISWYSKIVEHARKNNFKKMSNKRVLVFIRKDPLAMTIFARYQITLGQRIYLEKRLSLLAKKYEKNTERIRSL